MAQGNGQKTSWFKWTKKVVADGAQKASESIGISSKPKTTYDKVKEFLGVSAQAFKEFITTGNVSDATSKQWNAKVSVLRGVKPKTAVDKVAEGLSNVQEGAMRDIEEVAQSASKEIKQLLGSGKNKTKTTAKAGGVRKAAKPGT